MPIFVVSWCLERGEERVQRLLIATGSDVIASLLEKELSDEFLVEICWDGSDTLQLLHSFDPDILFLDTMLPGIDSFTVLHTLRSSGRSTGVILLSDLIDTVTVHRLASLGVRYILPKPCKPNLAVSNIRDLAFQLRYPNTEDWCIENELDWILTTLYFRIGPTRNKIVWNAILYRYHHPGSSYMKDVCPAVAHMCDGNMAQVEKAIRDAVHAAFAKGDMRIWQMYFPPGRDGVMKCPGGDEFISRIAQCLIQHARIKPPYEPLKLKAK